MIFRKYTIISFSACMTSHSSLYNIIFLTLMQSQMIGSYMEPNVSNVNVAAAQLPFVLSYYTWCFLIVELVVIIKLGLDMRPSSLIMELFMGDSGRFFLFKE